MQPIAEKFLLNDFYFYGQSHQLFRVGRLGVCYGHRAQSTGHRAQGTGHRARGTEHRAQSTGHRAQGTGHRARGTEHRAQSTGRRHGTKERYAVINRTSLN